MEAADPERLVVDRRVAELFALVAEALAGATDSLLGADREAAQRVVDQDGVIDSLVEEVELLAWGMLESQIEHRELRHLVGVLLILPELERSADLAEHVAQRAVAGLGGEMSPSSRGLVQRMAEVGLDMWKAVAVAFAERTERGVALDEADEELDILHDRLSAEVATGSMPAPVSAQVVLLARFYERLGDHAVNLARRIGALSGGARA
ncbi:MAG: phosphate signaling complex PhoU family protein [Acidimicrobiales bacterium]